MTQEITLGKRTIPPIVVAVTLGLAVLAGLGRVPMGALGVAILLGGSVVVLATLRDLGVGLALVPFICAAIPLSIGTGTQSPLVAGFIFCGVLIGLWSIRSVLARDFVIPRSPVFLPAVALILVWTLSYLFADAVHSPLVYVWEDFRRSRTGQLGVVVVSVGVLVLALKVGRELRYTRLATWSMIALGVVGIVGYYSHLDQTAIGRFLSTGGLFTLWVVALSYGQALYNGKLPSWLRIGLIALVAAWIYKATFLQTIWFSGWVPSAVAVAVITLFRSPRAFVPGAILSGILIVLNWPVVHAALWDAKVNEGDLTRIGIWDQALSLFHQYPVLGTGPAGYAAYYMSIYKGSQFSMSTHSNYMDVVIETGVVGAIVFAWFLFSLLIAAWQARTRWHTGFEGGFVQGAFGGLVGVLIAMSLGDWFIPFVYNATIAGFRYTVHTWVFLGLLATLATIRPTAAAPATVTTSALEQTVAGKRGDPTCGQSLFHPSTY